ncbi:MAG: GC-type dockerin domain-anchored protein [Planctomycetota bacterium]
MINRIALAVAALACSAGAALAQSATVSISSSAGTMVAPGDTVTVTVSADYDLAGAGSGVFGAAGFYGFGGDVAVSGLNVADASAATAATSANLLSGAVASTGASPDLVRAAAGRGLNGGLAANPAELFSFNLTIDPAAADGSLTLEFTGAVVLVRGDDLETFSSTPGPNQSGLTSNALTLTIMSTGGGCALADITATGACDAGNGDGLIDLSDFSCYLTQWSSQAPIADITSTGVCEPGNGDGLVNLSDFSCYLTEWSAGCP